MKKGRTVDGVTLMIKSVASMKAAFRTAGVYFLLQFVLDGKGPRGEGIV